MCALQIVYFKDGGQGSEGESSDDDVNVEALADVGQCTGSGVRDAPTNKEHVNNYD